MRKDGSFVLDYRGEIILETADAKPPWQATMAHCMSDDGKERACSASEVVDQRSAYNKKRADADHAAQALGLPGSDEESNRAFAAKLTKYAGWRSVAYRGKGVFDVDYHAEGRLTQDFVFPLMPDNNIVVPFVALRRRSDGSVLVSAPALTGGLNMFGPMAQQMGGDRKVSRRLARPGPLHHSHGRRRSSPTIAKTDRRRSAGQPGSLGYRSQTRTRRRKR